MYRSDYVVYDSPPVYRTDYVVYDYLLGYRTDYVVDTVNNRNAVDDLLDHRFLVLVLHHLEKNGAAAMMMTLVEDDHVVVVLPIPNFGSNLVGHYVTFPPPLLLRVATLMLEL